MSGWLAALFLLLGLIAWGGVGYLVVTYPPTPAAQAAFYPLFFLATMGTATPLMAMLHRAFPEMTGGHPSWQVTVRQSIWVGLFMAGVMGMRAARLRDLVLVVILGTVLILLETFWQQWERQR